MTDAAARPLARARKLAGEASVLAVIAIVLIILTSVLDLAAPSLRALGEITPDWVGVAVMARTLGAGLIAAAPNLLLAAALGELCKVLKEYERGRFFTRAAALGVRMSGEWALWALGFKIVLAPTLLNYVTTNGRGFTVHFETFDLGLIALAAFVMLTGRVLEAAASIKAENDQIV